MLFVDGYVCRQFPSLRASLKEECKKKIIDVNFHHNNKREFSSLSVYVLMYLHLIDIHTQWLKNKILFYLFDSILVILPGINFIIKLNEMGMMAKCQN